MAGAPLHGPVCRVVALGASIIVAVLQSRSAGAAAVVFGTIFGGFFFVCGVIGIISWGPDLIAPGPLIWITDEGFEQHVVHPHVFVQWSELADVSLITRSNVKTVAVQARNPNLLPRRWGAINTALGNPWWAGAVKVCLARSRCWPTSPRLRGTSQRTCWVPSVPIPRCTGALKSQRPRFLSRHRNSPPCSADGSTTARSVLSAAATSNSASTADTDQRCSSAPR